MFSCPMQWGLAPFSSNQKNPKQCGWRDSSPGWGKYWHYKFFFIHLFKKLSSDEYDNLRFSYVLFYWPHYMHQDANLWVLLNCWLTWQVAIPTVAASAAINIPPVWGGWNEKSTLSLPVFHGERHKNWWRNSQSSFKTAGLREIQAMPQNLCY